MLKRNLLLILPLLMLSSCFEVWDRIYIAKDGSGTFQREMNYTELMSMMGSFDTTGATLPAMKRSIDSTMNALKDRISRTEGITEVTLRPSDDSTIYNIRFNFRNVNSLNKAWRNEEDGSSPAYYSWKKGKLTISGGIPGMISPEPNPEQGESSADMLSTAKYTLDVQAGTKRKASSNKEYKDFGKRGLRYTGSYGDLMKNPALSKTVIVYK